MRERSIGECSSRETRPHSSRVVARGGDGTARSDQWAGSSAGGPHEPSVIDRHVDGESLGETTRSSLTQSDNREGTEPLRAVCPSELSLCNALHIGRHRSGAQDRPFHGLSPAGVDRDSAKSGIGCTGWCGLPRIGQEWTSGQCVERVRGQRIRSDSSSPIRPIRFPRLDDPSARSRCAPNEDAVNRVR
jgi:hypothetical protein